MPPLINLYEAKTTLSDLVNRAAKGEEIIIAKAGRPMARLMPLATQGKARMPGLLRGKIGIKADFDAPLPNDIAVAFGDGAFGDGAFGDGAFGDGAFGDGAFGDETT